MPKRTIRGRKRKAGPAKKGSGQAAAKRYHRAVDRLLNNFQTFGWRHYKDIEDYYAYKVSALERGTPRACVKIEECRNYIIMAKQKLKEKRMTNEAKRNNKAVAKQDEAVDLAKQYADVIAQLKAGKEVKGFTLLPANKAKVNHTVEHLLDLDEGMALCQLK